MKNEQTQFPLKVKCINDECSSLQFGEIYIAVTEYYGSDYVLEGERGTWAKSRFEIVPDEAPVAEKEVKEEYTGASVSYYSVPVDIPTDPNKKPYIAECNDIIEALGMNYAEGNAFKAIWRSCAARKFGVAKKGYDNGLYDAEKVVFFGERMVAMAKK
jgi:hypothetical protein